jgi:5'(3')-deoxyribonucleotidase
MIKTVFLDMDDVLADFMKGLHKALNISYDYFNYPYEKGNWDILGYQIKSDGGSLITFDQCNDYCNTSFWQDLEWMHDGYDILRAVFDKFPAEQIYLLTAPMPNLESASGKMIWVYENLPVYLKRTIITQAPKSLLAKPDTLLIDDKDENVEEFVKAGGYGILVPRPWNELHGWADETHQVVKNSLENLT